MTDYEFHPEAELEYNNAISYYSGVSFRLAEGFISEIEHGIGAIRRNPNTWRVVEDDVRHLVHRFPFGILYPRRQLCYSLGCDAS